MKKKICSLALLATAGVGSMFMSACSDPELENISVREGSIETTLLVGSEEPNWSDLVLNLTYDNDETATATKSDEMTISRIDTSVLGTQELVIKYKGLTTTVKIHIVAHEGDLYEYIGYQKPDSYSLYEGSTRDVDPTLDNEFSIGSYNYKVGDDNPFKFLPKITALNQDNQSVTITEYTSDVVVKENGVELTGSALTDVVAIDNAHSTFDFTEAAVGRTFEITVKPLNYTEDMPYAPITITVDVVNAWNAYEVKDLARIEDNAGSTSLWADKKTELGVDDTEIEGIVLHNDLEIKKSDLPSGMFHPAGATQDGDDIGGTLKDSMSFYTRDIDVNDTFSIYGNYFTISTCNEGDDAIPLVKYMSNDGSFGHSALFAFGGDNNYHPEDQQGRLVINSLSLIGNGSRQSTDEAVAGSLLGILTSAHNTTLENCLTRKFNTHIQYDGYIDYPTVSDMALCVRNTKMIDSFNNMIANWATRNCIIENSVLKQAGGPVISSTHPDADEHPDYNVNITIKNSILENYVGGSEAWFQKTGAAPIVTLLKSISAGFEQLTGSLIGVVDGINSVASLTKEDGAVINFLACTLGSDYLSQVDPIKNSIVIKDAENNVINSQDMADANVAVFDAAGLSAMPIFQGGDVFVGFNGTGLSLIITDQTITGGAPVTLLDLSQLASSELYATNKAAIDAMLVEFFNSDYVNIFYNGPRLGATFEMFHTAPEQN